MIALRKNMSLTRKQYIPDERTLTGETDSNFTSANFIKLDKKNGHKLKSYNEVMSEIMEVYDSSSSSSEVDSQEIDEHLDLQEQKEQKTLFSLKIVVVLL